MNDSVAVFTLGGTISMTGSGGVTPTLGAEELLAAVPSLRDGPPVTGRSLMRKPGADITFEDLEQVAAATRDAVDGGAAGVVVVQGTDTIEETAFALDLLLADLDVPVVVTGAMRNPTLPGADGPANIHAAVHCASSLDLRGLGVTVVMNDTIHAAARVQKRHASLTSAFRSDPHGPLGWFQEDRPVIVDRTRVRFDLPPPPGRPVVVPLLTVTLEPSPALLDAVLAIRPDALVIEGFGVGHVPAVLAEHLVEAAQSVPVVLASRTRGGSVHRHTYGFVGSERYLLDGGLVSAGWLDPIKARILAIVALRNGANDLDRVFGPVVPDRG
jgi:L-asparaginase